MSNHNRPGSLVMSIPELASTLNISSNLCYKLAKSDSLPVKVLHLGARRMMVSRQSVLALLVGGGNKESEGEGE